MSTKQSLDGSTPPVRVDTISAGKFRRYHTMPWWQQLTKIRTIVWPNIRDSVRVVIGFVQSFVKLVVWRPDVVFCKGGFVSLPVGIAAYILHIPIVIHDSDVHPGLTNKLLSRFATSIGTGSPLKNYPYPAKKSRYVGIPIDMRYRHYTDRERKNHKTHLGFEASRPLVVITGGGLGASSLNTAITQHLPRLLEHTQVVLICGEKNLAEVRQQTLSHASNPQFQLYGFISDKMVEVLAAADCVVARAGATTLLELSALGAPTILVPNPYLTGGHQTKNAKVYSDAKAAVVVTDATVADTPEQLIDAILTLVASTTQQQQLRTAIQTFARPKAAQQVATMIRAAGSHSK